MGWVPFNVKLPHSAHQSDGEARFTWIIDQSTQKMEAGAKLEYRLHQTAPAAIVFTTTLPVPPGSDGSYTLETITISGKIDIPAAGGFKGGKYNKLSSIVFTPIDTGTGTLNATFEDTSSPPDTDDPCDWTATVTTPIPAGIKKAAY